MNFNDGRNPRTPRDSTLRIVDYNERADWYYRHMRHLSMMLVAGVDAWEDFNIASALFELADNYHKRKAHACRPTLPYRF